MSSNLDNDNTLTDTNNEQQVETNEQQHYHDDAPDNREYEDEEEENHEMDSDGEEDELKKPIEERTRFIMGKDIKTVEDCERLFEIIPQKKTGYAAMAKAQTKVTKKNIYLSDEVTVSFAFAPYQSTGPVSFGTRESGSAYQPYDKTKKKNKTTLETNKKYPEWNLQFSSQGTKNIKAYEALDEFVTKKCKENGQAFFGQELDDTLIKMFYNPFVRKINSKSKVVLEHPIVKEKVPCDQLNGWPIMEVYDENNFPIYRYTNSKKILDGWKSGDEKHRELYRQLNGTEMPEYLNPQQLADLIRTNSVVYTHYNWRGPGYTDKNLSNFGAIIRLKNKNKTATFSLPEFGAPRAAKRQRVE
jgi:hypothetical protein